MQFRRQCRLRDISTVPFPSVPVDWSARWVRALGITLAGLVLAGPALAGATSLRLAQLGPNGGAGPSYGYQPYNDRNPTGFYHPNGTGYGHYYLTQKHHAPRFRAFRYRKFKGT